MTTAGATEGSEGSAGGLWLLAAALAVNSVLGPFAIGAVTYPLSETLVNQTIGLEAVSVLVVAPWAAAAGVLVRRGHRAGSIADPSPPERGFGGHLNPPITAHLA